MKGRGILNNIIDILPIELHIPGYQFCGPGTKLEKRLARGDQGINALDSACKEHDIAYSQTKDLGKRNLADKTLSEKAWERILSKESSFGEKASAYIVSNAMKAKAKLGMGVKIKQKMCNKDIFLKTVKSATKVLKKKKPDNINDAIKVARKFINKKFKGNKNNIKVPRVIKIPKTGGVLPLLPILTALGALGSINNNAATNAKKQLDESKRHNRRIESIAMGKGLFLKPYKKGYGLVYETSKNY